MDYAAEITDAMTDNVRFDAVISRLRADRTIDTNAMREIAHRVLGYQLRKNKGRADALEDIITTQRIEARGRARAAGIDRWAGNPGKTKFI
jgi:hypothetical protein